MSSDINTLNLVTQLKNNMKSPNNGGTFNYEVNNTFKYCNESVKTYLNANEYKTQLKSEGCPLIPNPYTELDNLPNTKSGSINKTEMAELKNRAKDNNQDVYDLILEEKCNIYNPIPTAGNVNNKLPAPQPQPGLACDDALNSIIFSKDNSCSYNRVSINLVDEVSYDCQASTKRYMQRRM